jgi:hypothetical protein
MSKSYKNAFYSKYLDIYTSIMYGGGDDEKGSDADDKGDIKARIAIYNKFIDLYALYYKNEEFVILINMDNESLLSWKHERMNINIKSVNNNQEYKCPKYPLYNLASIKDFIFTEPLNTKFCNDLIIIMYLGGYVNSLCAEKIMMETYNLYSMPYNLNKSIIT